MWKITATEYICRFLICKKIVFLSSFFFVQWYSSFLLVRLFCLFAFYLSLTPVFFFLLPTHRFSNLNSFFGRFFLLWMCRITISIQSLNTFFIHLNNIWALVWLPFHKCAKFLSPVANERRKSFRDYDFFLIFFIVERDFFFLRLMIKNDDRIVERYDLEILT